MLKKIKNSILNKIVKSLFSRFKYFEEKQTEKEKKLLFSKFQSIGFGVKLNGNKWFFSCPNKIVIGNNVHIGNNAFIKSEGGLIIGDNTHISRNLTVYTVNHDYSGEALPYDNKTVYKPVHIGKNVWIGMNVSIIPGISIGDGAIIGIGTIVNRNIDPLEIVGTQKNISLKFRNKNHYDKLNINKMYGGVNGELIKLEGSELFLPTYEQNKNKRIIFILSTGRSGSKSIVDILNQNPNIKAFHEDIRQLIRISTNIAHNSDNQEIYLSELKDIFQTKIWQSKENQLIVHSDQRLWNLIPFLSNYFANSKFIHLKREPVPSIISMLARGWYRNNEYPNYNIHDWAKYRLQGNIMGVIKDEIWDKYDNIQKCTWYWSYVNKSISLSLSSLPKERVLSLELENIKEDIIKLSSFIGIKDFKYSIEVSNKRQKSHSQNYEKYNSIEIKNFILSEVEKYK